MSAEARCGLKIKQIAVVIVVGGGVVVVCLTVLVRVTLQEGKYHQVKRMLGITSIIVIIIVIKINPARREFSTTNAMLHPLIHEHTNILRV